MIKKVTHAHLGPIWYHSELSDVPYSPNQWLVMNFFCRFLQQTGSNFISLPLKLTTHIAIFRSCALISMVWSEGYKRIIILNAWQSKTQQKTWICNVWYIFLHIIRMLWEYHAFVLKRVMKSNWVRILKPED